MTSVKRNNPAYLEIPIDGTYGATAYNSLRFGVFLRPIPPRASIKMSDIEKMDGKDYSANASTTQVHDSDNDGHGYDAVFGEYREGAVDYKSTGWYVIEVRTRLNSGSKHVSSCSRLSSPWVYWPCRRCSLQQEVYLGP